MKENIKKYKWKRVNWSCEWSKNKWKRKSWRRYGQQKWEGLTSKEVGDYWELEVTKHKELVIMPTNLNKMEEREYEREQSKRKKEKKEESEKTNK